MAVPVQRLAGLVDLAMDINLSSDYLDRIKTLTPEQTDLLEKIEDGAEKVMDVLLKIHPDLRKKMAEPEVNFPTMQAIQGASDTMQEEVVDLIAIARRTNDYVNAVALESILLDMLVPKKKEK